MPTMPNSSYRIAVDAYPRDPGMLVSTKFPTTTSNPSNVSASIGKFPNDLLYDPDGLVWCRPDSGEVTIGITSIYAAVTGRIAKISTKPLKVAYPSGTAIGFVESPKHFGPIRTPIGGVLLELNQRAIRDPRLVTDSPYGEGWVAQLRPSDLRRDRAALLRLPADRDRIATQIASLRVRCCAALPDP